MKYTVFLAGWLAAGIVAAADSGAIYHAGWTDLNNTAGRTATKTPPSRLRNASPICSGA